MSYGGKHGKFAKGDGRQKDKYIMQKAQARGEILGAHMTKNKEANKFMAKQLYQMVSDGDIEDNWQNERAIGFIVNVYSRTQAGWDLTPAQEKYLTDLFHRDRWYVEEE